MSNISIKGGKELSEFLQTLPVKIEKNLLRGALRSAAKIISDEAKRNAPVQDGDLRDSIRVSTRGRKGQVTASVKVGNKKVYYARFIEYAVSAHNIDGKGAGFLNFGGLFAKSVNHPGTQAKPFLRPALDSRSNEAINEVGLYIGKRLTKQGLNSPTISAESDENE
jgi:HK97 gp10 family phage protein